MVLIVENSLAEASLQNNPVQRVRGKNDEKCGDKEMGTMVDKKREDRKTKKYRNIET